MGSGIRLAIACAVVSWSIAAHATDYDITQSDDLYTRLQNLAPGDTVTVHAGTYTTPGTHFYEVTWPGTATLPITIRAAIGEHVVLMGDPSQNVINITGTFFTLDGFEIVHGSHGLRLRTVTDATLVNLVIHDMGDVGISCNFEPESCARVTIRHDEIYDTGHSGTGEGMYLGCNDELCRITDSVIADNYVHDVGGSQGDGIEIKTGSYGNVVEDNVIVRPNFPGITMYGFTGTHPNNIVRRNLVWHGKADNGIQIVGQIEVYDNLVIDSFANGIQSKPSQAQTPHDVTIVHNTIVGAGTACLKTNNWATETNQVIANNALYCSGGTALDVNGGAAANAVIANNIGLGASTAAGGFTQGTALTDFVNGAADWYPSPGSPLVNAGTAAHSTALDFNGTPRGDGMPDVGAYEVTSATNPGWIPTEGFKVIAIAGDNPNIAADDLPIDPMNPPGGGGCCDAASDPTSTAALALGIATLLGRRRNRRSN